MIDNSSCIGAIDTIKGHVADCFERCSAKGSTFTGTRKLVNLDSAISLIPQTVTSAKPYKCKLTHIESTGTQYIDTRFKPNQDTKIEIVISDWTNTGSSIFGTQSSSSDRYDMIIASSGLLRSYYNGTLANFGSSVTASEKTTIIRDGRTTSVGDAIVSHDSATFNCTTSLYLFAQNSSGTATRQARAKMYSCNIWDNGTLVRDFIPVLDWNDVPCMYDEVEGILYYNAGTGEFIAGDIVGTPTTGASFSGFGVTWAELPEESFTIDFGAYGTGWTALSCYSNSKDGHFNIVKISSSMCIISSAYFVDLESSWDDNYGIYPMARGTYRASYTISGNSITFTNAEYDGTGNGMTNYDDFRDMPMQISTEVNDYYINPYRLDRITVVY